MLTEIHIRHLATIDEVHLELPNGTIVITGETGAGKSIIMEAIDLALGLRASPDIVRAGKDKAEISLNFFADDNQDALLWLEENDFNADKDACMIRRIIYTDGRSRSYINGIPATQQAVRQLGNFFLQIHGQFEQHALLKTEKQRSILDHYAGHLELVTEVQHLAKQEKELAEAISLLNQQVYDAKQHNEFLHFQLSELDALHLQPGEWLTLENAQRKLANAEELLLHLNKIVQQLGDNEEFNITKSLHESIKALHAIQAVENKTTNWLETTNHLLVHTQDLHSELTAYLEQIELEPDELHHIEQRIQQIYLIARKYKVQPEELPILKETLQQQLTASASSEERLIELEATRQTLKKAYLKAAKKLSGSRALAARQLEQAITDIIQSLSLPHGQLHIEFTPETAEYAPHGLEKIHFLIKTNPDQALQPLAKVASGGELSRISLAIHLVTADQHAVSTLVFDEVDTGISGAIAEKVGKLLRRLGISCQVLCVTHLPQVAAQGHHHLLVEKMVHEQATFTQIHLLSEQEKTQEIARMLSGERITDAVLEHARAMLITE